MKRKTYITVKTQFEALHNWPNAPKIVGFLKDPHRHIFHVEASIPVTHDDRQLEFFMVKMGIDGFIKDLVGLGFHPNLGPESCEKIADRISIFLMTTYDVDTLKVSVFEDNENGATVIHGDF